MAVLNDIRALFAQCPALKDLEARTDQLETDAEGYSILPTLVSLTGACGLRVIWIFTIFAAQRSLAILYLSYPISWAVTATAHMICFWRAAKKLPKEDGHPVRG